MATRTRKKMASRTRKKTASPTRKKTASPTRRDTAPSSGPVTITYQVGDNPMWIRKRFELLVVACDPRNLFGVCDYRPDERAVFTKLRNFTFHTSLLKVKWEPGVPLAHAVVFAPEPLDRMEGKIYGFRNESAKEFGLEKASSMKHHWVTVYQLQKPESAPWGPDKFAHDLKQELKTLPWWPYGRTEGNDYEIHETVTTPYFDQFSGENLKQGFPWKFLDLQGKHNTIYVHASACFESILHCWQYANMLLDPKNKLGVKLPANRDAPIAILGAGASGILFANRLLRDLKYTNVEILEVTNRSDGKIHTIVKQGPYPPSGPKQPTVCELGACYLSPAYDGFVDYLKREKFLEGNRRLPLARLKADEDRFRGIVTAGQFPKSWPGLKAVMPYQDYLIEKAKQAMGGSWVPKDAAEVQILIDLQTYQDLHNQLMGDSTPMPTKRPKNFGEFDSKTFDQFLSWKKLLSLVGMLQYGYSVQGYGSLIKIPVYYGMTWITPAITQTIINNQGPWAKPEPIVTAWTKGWGDVWTQMMAGMKIIYNAKTTKIKRSN
jgi:hypothetical protein